MLYQACGLILTSNTPLLELLPASTDSPDFTFQLLPKEEYGFPAHEWIQEWEVDDVSWLQIAKTSSEFTLRFPDLADFVLSGDARNIRCYPASDVPLETIKHLLLDQVLPLVLNHHGKFVLHAGAVVLPQGAIAFLGASGLGKSTLTASFAQNGFPLLTDDCVLLEKQNDEIVVIPSYPGLRLWPDNADALLSKDVTLSDVAHYSSKKRLSWDTGELNFTTQPVLLRRLYILSDPAVQTDEAALQITKLSPHAAYIELFKHTFHLDITDKQRLAGEMNELSHLVTLGLVYKLSYPRDLLLLPKVREMILHDVQAETLP